MPLALMPYRSTPYIHTVRSPSQMFTKHRNSDPTDGLSSSELSPSPPSPSSNFLSLSPGSASSSYDYSSFTTIHPKLHKSDSGNSIYNNTKWAIASLAGLLTSSRSVLSTDIEDSLEDTTSSADDDVSSIASSGISSHRAMDGSDDMGDEFDFGDFLPTSTRNNHNTTQYYKNKRYAQSHSHLQGYQSQSLSPYRHMDETVYRHEGEDEENKLGNVEKKVLKDIGVLDDMKEAEVLSIGYALQNTVDLVGNSVRNILRNTAQGVHSNILLISNYEAEQRALYLAAHTHQYHTPTDVRHITDNNIHTISQSSGVLYWSQHPGDVQSIESGVFDCVLVFNLNMPTIQRGYTFLAHVNRILKVNGTYAGTGLFRSSSTHPRSHTPDSKQTSSDNMSPTSAASETPSPTSSSSSSTSPSSCSCWSVRSYREITEQAGFTMHTAIDLSLEGVVLLHDSGSNTRVKSGYDIVDSERRENNSIVCARFLASKHAFASFNDEDEVSQDFDTNAIRSYHPLPQYNHTNYYNNKATTISNDLHIIPTPTGSPIERYTEHPAMSSNQVQYEWKHALASDSCASTPTVQQQLHTGYTYDNLLSMPESIYSSLRDPVGITGISLGLPNASDPQRPIFHPDNIQRLIRGEQQIRTMSEIEKNRLVEQNVFTLTKNPDGSRGKKYFDRTDVVLKVNSKLLGIDLVKQYNVPSHVIEALDLTFTYAIAAGLEALRDAGINVMNPSNNGIIGLPIDMQDTTGVIFASSFPGVDSVIQEVTKAVSASYEHQLAELVAELHATKANISSEWKKAGQAQAQHTDKLYEYDRKLLFKLLVLANAQLAELIKAKGPNTHVNAACAGTTQAVSLAHDWIRLGRCERVVVISADAATSDRLAPYISSGFMCLGAASTCGAVEDASAPFDARRTGMVMGAGAVGLVVENERGMRARESDWRGKCKARVVDSHIGNSAFHACLMDKDHISKSLVTFLQKLEKQHHIHPSDLARNLVYMSHETGTGVCASIELRALEAAFGDDWHSIQIANTKGFTGHAMGVAFEEVMAVHALHQSELPPIANLKNVDKRLKLSEGQLSTGGHTDRQYVLRFAAGFGSQLAYVLYTKA